MRVFIIHIRKLVMAAAVCLILLVAGLYLLLSDPLDVALPFRSDPASVFTSNSSGSGLLGEKPALRMDVKLDGDTAHVKLVTDHFTFVKEGNGTTIEHGKGHAHLYLDGKLIQNIYQPEFLVKRLPAGKHELRVELAYSNHMPYQVEASQILDVK